LDPNEPDEPQPEFPDPEDADPELKKAFANQLTTIILLMEGILGVAGVMLGIWFEIRWLDLIRPDAFPILAGLICGVTLVAVHAALLFPGKEWNPLRQWIYKPFARTFLDRMRMLSVEDIILISIVSGCAEELLFRGWFQTTYGIVPASILFGIIHIWGKPGIPYGIYAIGIGFVLGGLFAYTGNLWAPVLAHTLNNFLGLMANKYNWTPDVPNPQPQPED